MGKLPVEKSCLIDGKKVSYWVYNPTAKKPILAIHGLRGTHHGLQYIAQKLPEYAIITPDLPGHGSSEPLDTTHSVGNFAHFLEHFITTINLSTPCIILGHSFGCSIVGKFAKDNPDKVKKIILINPVVKGGSRLGELIAKSYYRLGGALPEKLGTALLRSKLNTRLMTFFITTTRRKRLRKRVYEQHLAYFSTFANRRTVIETFDSTMTEMVDTHAHELDVPILMIIGLKDNLAPPSGQHALFQKLKNAQLRTIPYVGHLIHYETPELAARYIREFVD